MLLEDEIWNLGQVFLRDSIAESYFYLLFDVFAEVEFDQVSVLIDKEINANSQIEEIDKQLALTLFCTVVDNFMQDWESNFRTVCESTTQSILEHDPLFLGGKPMDFLNDMAAKWPEEGLYEHIESIRDNVADDLAMLLLQIRQLDFKRMDEIINEKWIYLGPILRNAEIKGVDRYGETDHTLFIEECGEFAKRFIMIDHLMLISVNESAQRRYVTNYSTNRLTYEKYNFDNDIPQDGLSFEYWCAAELNKYGWQCTVTQGSNDQGVDILAHKNRITVAIQCKRYSASVGNKAVQEIYAGQKNINADYACVITTSDYTRSAKELSMSTNVLLLHVSEIPYLSEYLN